MGDASSTVGGSGAVYPLIPLQAKIDPMQNHDAKMEQL